MLGWTERGQPRHPLYVPKDTTPECLTLGAEGCGLHEAEDPRWERLLAGLRHMTGITRLSLCAPCTRNPDDVDRRHAK